MFRRRFPDASAIRIPNPYGQRPKTFEIDLLIAKRDALEIKWRDATTDGDHITKEHARLRAIAEAGYKPVRIMFYYPNRAQAIRIQQTLETLYAGVQGEYYYRDAAWDYVKRHTEVDLKAVLQSIARERVGYPTQKPILLLEQILTLVTEQGDWVLDPFCGSGTTLVASKLLERNAVGIDISPDAIALTKCRLEQPFKTESPLLKKGREEAEPPLTADVEGLL